MLSAPEESKRLLDRAASLSQDDPWTLFRAAAPMFDLAEYDRARTWTRRVLEIAPEDFVFQRDLVHLVGRLAGQRGNDKLTEEALMIAFEEEPEALGHGRWLAQFYASRGREIDALKVISKALSHRPEDKDLRGFRDELLAEFTTEEDESP